LACLNSSSSLQSTFNIGREKTYNFFVPLEIIDNDHKYWGEMTVNGMLKTAGKYLAF